MARAASDRTFLRVTHGSCSRLSSLTDSAVRRYTFTRGCRKYHEAAALAETTKDHSAGLVEGQVPRQRFLGMNQGSLAVKGRKQNMIHPFQELERRVAALDEAIDAEQSAARPFFYTEEDLLTLYQDIMAVPIPETILEDKEASLNAVRQAEEQEDLKIIDSLQRRLLDEAPAESSQHKNSNGPVYRRILVCAHEIFNRIDATAKAVNPGAINLVPLPMLSIREFEALLRQTLAAQDSHASEVVLELLKKANLPLSSEHLTRFLEMFASTGDVKAADDILATFLTESPTEEQKHLHIKTHLRAAPSDEIPVSAMDLLHVYEEQNVPVGMKTYTLVISSLLTRPLSVARAQAWDLFAHMRYVAHPVPDDVLYTQMIRACASPVTIRYSSEPEKALDLWTEMTVDNKIPPTVDAYNAVILACARSGEKMYVNEAFRLSRQMLDAHRDARGMSAFRPNRKTFCALLEGAKRTGNLARARWILAEMVKPEPDSDVNAVEMEIDEEVMMHVFNAYASYKPPTLLISSGASTGQQGSSQQITATQSSTASAVASLPTSSTSSSSSSNAIDVGNDGDAESFAHIPPQSHAEVIREVKILMKRIIDEQSSASPTDAPALPFSDRKFCGVRLTSRLLGAYVSVFYKHASLEIAEGMLWALFDQLGVERTPRVYVEALERCGMARRGRERDVVVGFADRVWERWLVLEDEAIRAGKPIPARMVERAYIAMIRTLSLTDNLDRAMSQLRNFAAKYPPQQVRNPLPKPHFRSTRTSLVGTRPLVRMASVTEVPDDYVPPLITFRNIDVLHHRLIDYGRKSDIDYVTWVCKAYEWALRVRRDEAVKARPPKVNDEIATPVVERIAAAVSKKTGESEDSSTSDIDLGGLLYDASVALADEAVFSNGCVN